MAAHAIFCAAHWHRQSCLGHMLYQDKISRSDEAPANETTVIASEPSRPALPQVKVWLVDDNDELRTLVAEVLGSRDGIECARHFSSPDELLSTLASKPGPDVILLDVQMGERNGLEAVRPIKSLTRSTRVLMFTTCYNHEWRERALNDGAADYLLKSDGLEKVVARIRCPANDPIPVSFARHRSRRSSLTNHPVNSIADKSPRLLSRTLGMLRSLWN